MNESEQKAGLAKTANYAYAKKIGNQLFVAGQVPHDADGNIVGKNDSAAQANQCLQNLDTLLRVYDFDQRDIQKLTVYVVGEKENLHNAWTAVENWFNNEVPPATLLGVNQLGYEDQLVEIDTTIIKEVNS